MDFFIVDHEHIRKKLNSLTEINRIDDEVDYQVSYIDAAHAKWQKTVLWSDELDKEIELLYNDSIINGQLLISLITQSNNIDEIAAASLLLYSRNFDSNKLLREELLKMLEAGCKSGGLSHEKIKVCVYESGLYNATNKESILYKPHKEVQKDYEFYKNIAAKAKKLCDK